MARRSTCIVFSRSEPRRRPVNAQPYGASALVVACKNATPGTMIRSEASALRLRTATTLSFSATLPRISMRDPGSVHVR